MATIPFQSDKLEIKGSGSNALFTKLTRSASSNTPGSHDSSLSNSRPQSMRSISGSIDANIPGKTIGPGGGETTTASPLITPGDGPIVDPISTLTNKRAMTASPSALDHATAASLRLGQPEIESAEIHSQLRPGLEQIGHGMPRRSWTSGTATLKSVNAIPSPSAVWLGNQGNEDANNPVDELSTVAQQMSLHETSFENRTRLASYVHEMQGTPPPNTLAHTATQSQINTTDGHMSGTISNRSGGGEQGEIGEMDGDQGGDREDGQTIRQQQNAQQESFSEPGQPSEQMGMYTIHSIDQSTEPLQHQQYPLQSQQHPQQHPIPPLLQGGYGQMPTHTAMTGMRMPYPQQMSSQSYGFGQTHPHYQAAPTYALPSGANAGSFTSSMPLNPAMGIPPTDSSSSLGATPPDPYAPYGVPSAPSIPSNSTPQSPSFHPLNQPSNPMQQSETGQYMVNYNSGHSHVPGMMIRPPYGPIGSGAVIGPGGQNHQGVGGTMPYMMGNQLNFTPNSPPQIASGLPSNPERHSRRSSHISQGSISMPSPQQYGQGALWAGMTPSSPVGPSMMHLYGGPTVPSTNWSQQDPRSGNAHRRIISSQFGAPLQSSMPFMQQSPPTFGRPPPSTANSSRDLHSRTPSSMSFGSSFGRMQTSEGVARSPLLEEFRTRHNRGRRFELQDVRGHVVEFSSDQHGSRFIQEKLGIATEEELQMVFDEILLQSSTLMTDVFGNYVIQKLIEYGTPEMRFKLVEQMNNRVLQLSLSTYGCRVVQRALDFIDMEDKMLIANELSQHIVPCVQDQNANHVIQKILERVTPTSQIDFIPTSFQGKVYSLAAHCYSCRVLQRIFEHCEEEQSRPLLEELMADAERLMHDQYGNYVIQWILRKASREEQDRIIRIAKGNVLRLSQHKFASNVVEQIIAAASDEDRYVLIEEIMQIVPNVALGGGREGMGTEGNNPSTSSRVIPSSLQSSASTGLQEKTSNVLSSSEANVAATLMMRDQYGNYVLQRFLELSEGQQKQRLISLIKPTLINLKRSPVGYTKHLAAIERLLETNVSRTNAGTMTGISTNPGLLNLPFL